VRRLIFWNYWKSVNDGDVYKERRDNFVEQALEWLEDKKEDEAFL